MRHRAAYTLARQLAVAYLLLVVYASLYPLAGWRASGAGLLDFLSASWPRYYTAFDLALNVAGYLPLGFLLVAAVSSRFKPGWAVLATLAVGGTLSFAMETLQNFLPSRVPSNVDLACNTIGTLCGALLATRWGRIFADRGWLSQWRRRRIVRGALGDLGLVLMGAWLLTQLSPDAPFLGSGDFRSLLDFTSPIPYSAETFRSFELAITACSLLGAGLIAWLSLRDPSYWLLLVLLLAAPATRALATAVQIDVESALTWATPGNLQGYCLGTVVLLIAVNVPPRLQQLVAAASLIAATALINIAPDNPYVLEAQANWHAGQFLNFNGLTRLVALLWPYSALTYLLALSTRSTDRS